MHSMKYGLSRWKVGGKSKWLTKSERDSFLCT